MAVFTEGRIDDGLQHLQQRLLDQPIRHRRDAQLPLAPVRLRNQHPSYRLRPVSPRQQRLSDLRPLRPQHQRGLLDVEPVRSRCTLVGLDPLPRPLQVLSRQRSLQQEASSRLRRCRPCALVFTRRAAGFVTGELTPGFTRRFPLPPGSPRHLTHGL